MDSIQIELLVRRILATCAILTLVIALGGLLRSRYRQIGRTEGAANALLNWPITLIATGFFVGGLFLYRTWTMAIYAFIMSGLPFRARREDQVLAKEFGQEWEPYIRRVPGWFPRLCRNKKRK
ncbi:MAG: hypothetical protein AB1798_02020 [Spirochaetota bacterium]